MTIYHKKGTLSKHVVNLCIVILYVLKKSVCFTSIVTIYVSDMVTWIRFPICCVLKFRVYFHNTF